MEDPDIIREFLIESSENLSRLDQEMVELEQHPDNADLLASVFRTIHTIKGTCGFLGFSRLEALAHIAEDILNELRQNRRRLDGPLTSAILQAVDAIKRILKSIEAGEEEGEVFEGGVLALLKRARENRAEAAAPAALPERQEDHPAGDKPALTPTSVADTALRVDVGLLDRLMNLVGELVLTRNQVLQYTSSREDGVLNTISQRLNLLTTELQESVMKTRMQPIGLLWNKLPRMVRDLANSLGKQIDLDMEGAGTELDRTIIEAIKDPLTHIIRNSCDHGIEAPETRRRSGKPAHGRLSLRAYHEGGQVNIQIADDGAGIDPERVKAKAIERQLIDAGQAARLSSREAVNLVFLPGFSTAAEVTKVSGRGVGMDVVKTHIERIGGAVELVSEAGCGATVKVRIPLTLAIVPGLVVDAGGERFVIPQINLHELIRAEGEAANLVEYVHSVPVIRRRDILLPVVDLSTLLGLRSQRAPDEISIVVVQADDQRFGLIVDQIGDCQEIVVKPIGLQATCLNCYAGATIMGDGRISLILDVSGLGVRSGVVSLAGQNARAAAEEGNTALKDTRQSFLLCHAGTCRRLAIPLGQVARLEKIPRNTIERAGGQTVLQYRGRILPLLDVVRILGSEGIELLGSEISGAVEDPETCHVVVTRRTDGAFGLIVDGISDIIEETVAELYQPSRPGLLGSAVVAGRVTDFLDVEAMARHVALSSAAGLGKLSAALAGDACIAEVFA